MSGKEWVEQKLFRGTERLGGAHVIEWLEGISLAATQQVGPLEITPLFGGPRLADPPLPLHAAVAEGSLEVRERGPGSVNVVVVRNGGPRPVLISEGETLVGCKQNRVVSHAVIVGPGAQVDIPVGCMEQGRWDLGGGAFRMGGSPVEPSFRSAAIREAKLSRRRGAAPRLNQSRLWDQVRFCMASEKVASGTDDYHELLQAKLRRASREQPPNFTAVKDQVGFVATTGSRLLGIEIVGHPDLWQGISARLLASYRFAAEGPFADVELSGTRERPTAQSWLQALREGSVGVRPGLGIGRDLELEGSGVTGAGLWHDGLVRLAAFAR